MAPCPVPGGSAEDAGDGTYGMPTDQVPTKSFRRFGLRTAEQWSYAVRCNDGHAFTSRIWWFPRSRVLVQDYSGAPLAETVVGTLTFNR